MALSRSRKKKLIARNKRIAERINAKMHDFGVPKGHEHSKLGFTQNGEVLALDFRAEESLSILNGKYVIAKYLVQFPFQEECSCKLSMEEGEVDKETSEELHQDEMDEIEQLSLSTAPFTVRISNGMVVVPIINRKYVLFDMQYRFPVKRKMLGFPRCFTWEYEASAEQFKEFEENPKFAWLFSPKMLKKKSVTYIGDFYPDTGLDDNCTRIYALYLDVDEEKFNSFLDGMHASDPITFRMYTIKNVYEMFGEGEFPCAIDIVTWKFGKREIKRSIGISFEEKNALQKNICIF
ncbi:hypothetical protein KKH43_02650 [Patescibacteria group bacterium]|nr:hypothetical protein [Patescibacteria group bacterium]